MIVPEPLLKVVLTLMFTVPRLLRSAVIVRGPLALFTLMTPGAALVNVPVVTTSVSPYPAVVVES